MAAETSLFRMVDLALDGRLRELVQEGRSNGMPWRDLAADLRRRGAVVSHETLRAWFSEEDVPQAGAA